MCICLTVLTTKTTECTKSYQTQLFYLAFREINLLVLIYIMKGIYILILKIDKEIKTDVGKMGKITFKKSFYAYVGSAMSGIHRLKRHLENLKEGSVKNKHWHIDFIIPYCKPVGWVFAECSDSDKEKELAIYLSKNFDYIKGFGSSDSPAPSHLFKTPNIEKLKANIIKALDSIELENFRINQT